MAENANPTEAGAVIVVAEEKNKVEGGTENTMTGKTIQLKSIAGLLSILCFVLSLPILASIIWLLYMKDYDCENLLRLPKLQMGIGICLIFVFLISNAALLLRSRFPMPGLLLVMVPLIVILTMGLALVGAYKMENRKIPASPMWFKLKVHDNNHWNNIKSCIYDTGACNDYVRRSLTVKSYDFNSRKLSSMEVISHVPTFIRSGFCQIIEFTRLDEILIVHSGGFHQWTGRSFQSGCCTPPAICQMEYVNATFWRKGDGAVDKSYPYDNDCDSWKNDLNILCYDCQSCKEGFLKTLESKWWKLGIFLVLMAILLIVSHLFLFLVTMWEHYVG